MEGQNQTKGDADIQSFKKVMDQNSKSGDPRAAGPSNLVSDANYQKGSIEKTGTSHNANSGMDKMPDCNYLKDSGSKTYGKS